MDAFAVFPLIPSPGVPACSAARPRAEPLRSLADPLAAAFGRVRLRATHPRDAFELRSLADAVAVLREPSLGGRKTPPARYGCGEIDLTPFRMVGRRLQLRDLREERGDELLDLPVLFAVLRPVVGDQDRADRERLDAATGGDQTRIVVARQARRQEIVAQRLCERHRQDPQAR